MNLTAAVPRRVRWGLALGLVLVSPLFAEYLIGYDDSTGNLPALLAGLMIFCPLYGAPALLVRELARRHGLRWPGIVALAAGLAVVQAGVIDQSMFSMSYRDIDYWDAMIGQTWLAPLGLSAYASLSFLAGHVIWSFCIPIALVESMNPKASGQPWLRLPGLAATVVAYLAAAWIVLAFHFDTETDHASIAQILGCLAVVAALTVFAFTRGRRRAVPRQRDVPAPWIIGLLSLIAGVVFNFGTEDWFGVGMAVALLVLVAATVARLARSPQWTSRHLVALAAGALLSRALVAFPATPLGDIDPVAKYTHNAVFLLITLLLGAWAYRASRLEAPPTVSR